MLVILHVMVWSWAHAVSAQGEEESESDFEPRRSTRQRSNLVVRLNRPTNFPVGPLRRTRAAGPVRGAQQNLTDTASGARASVHRMDTA